MIKTLQSSELRKHSLVCLNDLLLTSWIGYHYPGQPSFLDFSASSTLQGGVIDNSLRYLRACSWEGST